MTGEGWHATEHRLNGPAWWTPPGEWTQDALCAQVDPESFFPEKGGSTKEAKAICAGCDVRAECLQYALDHDERFGVWGGLSERERRKLKPPNMGACTICGQPVTQRPQGQRGHPHKTCSDTCRQQARRDSQTAYDKRKKTAA